MQEVIIFNQLGEIADHKPRGMISLNVRYQGYSLSGLLSLIQLPAPYLQMGYPSLK